MLIDKKIETEVIRTFYNPYLSEVETTILVALIKSVRPKVMIEIGCQQGRTAKTILDHVPSLQRYIGIDIPFGKRTTLLCQRSEIPYTAGLWVADNIRFALALCDHGSLELTADNLEPCDAVFIDGDHSAKAVLHDSYLAYELVRSGGIIVWHDMFNPAVEVTQVLNRLVDEEHWPIVSVADTWLAYMRV
jgi:predicted O-methyltransferase YrrM